MKEENRRCWNCCKYSAFYTRGQGNFKQEKIGKCNEHHKIVEKQDVCSEWLYRFVSRARRNFTLQQLADLMQRLDVLEQILKEEAELDKKILETWWKTE